MNTESIKGVDTELVPPSFEAFTFECQMNKASLVALHRAGILDDATASRIAGAIDRVIAEHEASGSPESLDYLDFERWMSVYIGPEASLVHVGRSRQDLLSTSNRHRLRMAELSTMDQLLTVRDKMLTLAARHVETVVPAYTHSVPAQPTTFAHYLLAFVDAFERTHQRLEESYERINQSPLGAAVLATSRFRLDRELLANLLGFTGVVENSYGANHVAPIDATLEVCSLLALIATHTSQFAQDLAMLHATSRPWVHIAEGPLTGISSIMPQKRNPRVLEFLRELVATVLGRSQMFVLLAHNTTTGVTDTRESLAQLSDSEMGKMLDLLGQLIDSLEIDAERALAECRQDYSTMTELADMLFAEAAVPFRIGHHFASLLTDHGREAGEYPTDISYDTAAHIYRSLTKTDLPLSAEQFRQALDPVSFVHTRAGQGGPQPSEVRRILDSRRQRLDTDTHALASRRDALAAARHALDSSFQQLLPTHTEA